MKYTEYEDYFMKKTFMKFYSIVIFQMQLNINKYLLANIQTQFPGKFILFKFQTPFLGRSIVTNNVDVTNPRIVYIFNIKTNILKLFVQIIAHFSE